MSLNRSHFLGLSLMGQGQGRENPLAGSFGEMGNEFPIFDLPLVDWEGECHESALRDRDGWG